MSNANTHINRRAALGALVASATCAAVAAVPVAAAVRKRVIDPGIDLMTEAVRSIHQASSDMNARYRALSEKVDALPLPDALRGRPDDVAFCRNFPPAGEPLKPRDIEFARYNVKVLSIVAGGPNLTPSLATVLTRCAEIEDAATKHDAARAVLSKRLDIDAVGRECDRLGSDLSDAQEALFDMKPQCHASFRAALLTLIETDFFDEESRELALARAVLALPIFATEVEI